MWRCTQVYGYYLYNHPDVEVNLVKDAERTLVLIGEIFDYQAIEKNNIDILSDILAGANSKEELFLQMKQYAGSYVVIYMDEKDGIIVPDARATREVYYCRNANQIVCGSQPNLVAEFSKPKLHITKNDELLDFYKNDLWDSRWVGDETCYEGIKHLLPNHYLDIRLRSVERFWPDRPIPNLPLEDAVATGCQILKGTMSAIVQRYSPIMAITAGTDSRVLLAASKGIRDKIHYFINDIGLGHNHPDVKIPREIFDSIGVPFTVYKVPKDVDDQFRDVFLNNTFLASEHYLPAIYHVFYKKHGGRMCILGVGEIGRRFYGAERRSIDSYRLAYKLGYMKSNYVRKKCEELIAEMEGVAKMFGVGLLSLFYWEQRLGNWGAVRNSESYIAIDKVDPFNSHILNEVFLGVDERHRNGADRPCVLFREMIRSMWPELLKWPINPPSTMKGKLSFALNKLGILQIVKEVRYQLDYIKYQLLEKI